MNKIQDFIEHFINQTETAVIVVSDDKKSELLEELNKNNFKQLDLSIEILDGNYYLEIQKDNIAKYHNIAKQIYDRRTMLQFDEDGKYTTKEINPEKIKLVLIINQETIDIADKDNYDFINNAGMVEYLN